MNITSWFKRVAQKYPAPGRYNPTGWTTSAFENYFVTVETTPEPKEETTETPHYE